MMSLTLSTPRKNRVLRRSFSLASIAVLVAILSFVIARPYAIADWFRLHDYVPPAAVAALASDTTMTDSAKHLFYVNHPGVLAKAAFRDSCPKYDNQTIVIGCYQSGQRGIYVLKVTDERLAGVEQVTAAHETLHAAYDRLSKNERQRVDQLLQDYADNQLKDTRIKAALKGYETSEPGQQLNEMHSIFGTEIANLPSELETYYSRYFSSRKTVTDYAARYQEAFSSRQTSITQYDTQLQAQSAQIQANTKSLKTSAAAIDSDRDRLDGFRAANNIEQYNAGVPLFNDKVDQYNTLLGETRALITQYNDLVVKRNAIADQTVELQSAIDSSKLPPVQ